MLTIGALQARTKIFLSHLLFHILMLSTYGVLLVSAEGSAAASAVYKGAKDAPFCLVWFSHASGGNVGFLFVVSVCLGVALESLRKALELFFPGDMFPVPCSQFECYVPKAFLKQRKKAVEGGAPMLASDKTSRGKRGQVAYTSAHGPLDTECGNG